MSVPVHSFAVSIQQAIRIQNELAAMVELSDTLGPREYAGLVGGADVAFITHSPGPSERDDGMSVAAEEMFPHEGREPDSRVWKADVTALACVVTMDTVLRQVVETVYATAPVLFSYIPGLLTFREGPAVVSALGKLSALPGVMLYDGAGIAHPRGLGLASHMAVLTGIPSIGCAKSLLAGSCDEPEMEKGAFTYICYRNRVVGTCLRTRDGVRPVYVSPGSGFSVDAACRFVLTLCGRYRLPEPTRMAHNLVTEYKRQMIRGNLERDLQV